MKQFLVSLIVALGFSGVTHAVCSKHQTTGVDYFGAKYNCEAILNGTAQNCQPGNAQGSVWYCACFTGCQSSGPYTPKIQTTIGADFFGAKYNCEAILGGYAMNCQPGNAQGTIWSCKCQLP